MIDLDLEPVGPTHGRRDVGCPRGIDLGRDAAHGAKEVAVLARRKHVVLLPTVRAVEVADEPELLQDIQGSVHGRRCGGRVDLPAALDELSPRDVAVGRRQRLDDRPALRRGTQPSGAKAVTDLRPGGRQ